MISVADEQPNRGHNHLVPRRGGPQKARQLARGEPTRPPRYHGLTMRSTLPPEERSPLDVVAQFNDALNRHDASALAQFLTDDTVFENTGPAPDGARFEGKTAVMTFWEGWLAANPDASIESEEAFAAGDRVVVRWVYRKLRHGAPWHLRGVDVFTVRQGRIAQKCSYVKG